MVCCGGIVMDRYIETYYFVNVKLAIVQINHIASHH